MRLDLRLADNPALNLAAQTNDSVVPVYIWDPEEAAQWRPGGATMWWLHQSLDEFDRSLQTIGSRLIIRSGKSLEVLRGLIAQTGANSVFWNRRYDPHAIANDTAVKAALKASGIKVETFNSNLLHEPAKIYTQQGGPFKVFTPFWNNLSSVLEPPLPAPHPRTMHFPEKEIDTMPLKQLKLEPSIDWAAGFREYWKPGEAGAKEKLKQFLHAAIFRYATGRDRPDQRGVSMLSPHMHFGEISPRQIWHAVQVLQISDAAARKSAEIYLKELGWREFAHHVLYHFPDTCDNPLREQFANFPWSEDPDKLRRWQKGQTGYPIVDAGMRQLWQTGWMHNRVRMIVASFLTKDLLISWHHGAKWFWDTLVDADLASNTLGWQWAGGCGADAAPYFRIFNPVLQGEKFDPEGDYVKRWVPELSKMPAKWIHQPWACPAEILSCANVKLGQNYPMPIIDHSLARKRALEALAQTKAPADPAALLIKAKP